MTTIATMDASSPKSIGQESTVVKAVPPMNVKIQSPLKMLDATQSQPIRLMIRTEQAVGKMTWLRSSAIARSDSSPQAEKPTRLVKQGQVDGRRQRDGEATH